MLTAIETRYKGHRFRSRLEARWAVYFDRLGLKWEYEVEGYRFDDGTCYLPDFKVWTPQDQPMWVEVKASNVKQDPKFEKFEAALKKEVHASYCEGDPTEVLPEARAYLVSGTPLDWFNGGVPICPRCGGFESDFCHPCDEETPFGGCNELDETGIGGVALNAHKGWIELRTDRDEEVFESFVLKAATAAQQARFEHGEQG